MGNSMISESGLFEPRASLGAGVTRTSALRSNLNLTRELAVTTFKLKYTGSVLGYAWSLVKPLLIFGTTYLVFAVFLLRGRTSAAENFPVELLLGIVVWTFFAEATATSTASVVANGHILRKAYFPRWILVVASTLSVTMTLTVNMVLILVVGLPLGWFHVGWHTLVLPLLFVELYVLVAGIGLLLSALYVFYRDIAHVWEILLQILFYGSAVVFPFSLIPAKYKTLIAFNPMAQIIEDMRRALVSQVIPWSSQVLGPLLIVPIAAVLVIFGLGFIVFTRRSPHFGEAL
jgi:ABC-2 type transport system permease protein